MVFFLEKTSHAGRINFAMLGYSLLFKKNAIQA
jgi:hypothetical protein